MRSISLSLLAASLLVAFPALAQQDPWTNTDANCAPEYYQGARQAAEAAQEQSVRDAQAVNDYYKKIKEAPTDSNDKMLSCVDVSWPDMSFSGMLAGVEPFIAEIGDEAVAEGCRQMRRKVREADSLFNTDNLTKTLLDPQPKTPPQGSGQTNRPPGQQPAPTQPRPQPTPRPNVPPPTTNPGDPGGGLLDLIRPQPRPQPPTGGGDRQVQP